jgi:flavin-binding protein dodecin
LLCPPYRPLDAKGKVEAYRAKVKVSFKFEGT